MENIMSHRIAQLKHRLARLEKKTFFDFFKEEQDIFQEELEKSIPSLKLMYEGQRRGNTLKYELVLKNNHPLALYPTHKWSLLIDLFPDNEEDTIQMSILVSPYEWNARKDMLLNLSKKLYLWDETTSDNRASIKASIKDFISFLKNNHPKMVEMGLNTGTIPADESKLN